MTRGRRRRCGRRQSFVRAPLRRRKGASGARALSDRQAEAEHSSRGGCTVALCGMARAIGSDLAVGPLRAMGLARDAGSAPAQAMGKISACHGIGTGAGHGWERWLGMAGRRMPWDRHMAWHRHRPWRRRRPCHGWGRRRPWDRRWTWCPLAGNRVGASPGVITRSSRAMRRLWLRGPSA